MMEEYQQLLEKWWEKPTPQFTQEKAKQLFTKLSGHANHIEPCGYTIFQSWMQNWNGKDGNTRYHAILIAGGHIKLICVQDGRMSITYYDYDTLEMDAEYTAWAERQPLYP